MQTKESLEKFVSEFEFNDWNFNLKFKNDGPYLQITFMASDNMNPDSELSLQSCRKWMLSYYMTDDEVVGTAWKAVEAAVLHEAREQFKWKDEPIYRPHIDPQVLWDISNANKVLKRDETNYKREFEILGGGV